ncbi:hypothetical protein TNCV_309901 [Trichonephila clavipes]|nr:hypothetical protein TNCV_309901 [Trichonephila clavipes]
MVFDIHLWISFTPNAAVLFVDVAIQPEVRFLAKQNSLMKIRNNSNLVLGPFDESTPCLMIVLMNCQTKLRINHLTAVKLVAILGRNRDYTGMWVRLGSTDLMAGKAVFLRGLLSPIRVVELTVMNP